MREWPYLARIDDSQGTVATVVVMGQANATLWFDLVSGQFTGRFGTRQTLVHDDAGEEKGGRKRG